LSVSVLAGFGTAAILRQDAGGRLLRRVALLTVAAVIFTFGALIVLTPHLRLAASRKEIVQLSFRPWLNPATAIPLVVICLSIIVLLIWGARPASNARRALLLLILILDLASFGWFYEWRFVSSGAKAMEPPAPTARYAQTLRASGQRLLPVRGVLTPRAGFPPNASVLWNVPSASGYSALILSRVSRLLDMTNDGGVAASWHETTNASLDLLAVRYAFVPGETDAATAAAAVTAYRTDTGGRVWASADLGLVLGAGCNAPNPETTAFTLPTPAHATGVALVTALACSIEVADATPLLRITVHAPDGTSRTQLLLRAGEHTSEWAHDCDDVRPRIKHGRAPVYESRPATRGAIQCTGHSYLAFLPFERPGEVASVRLEWLDAGGALEVKRISLLDATSGRTTPLQSSSRLPDEGKWRHVEDVAGVKVYENLRARPRAWLVPEVLSLPADAVLQTIKSSRLPDGRAFDPSRIAFVEEPYTLSGVPLDANAEAAVVQSSDTAVTVRVKTNSNSFLVLSDVNYPGWTATLDGQPAQLLQTNFVSRGVPLPPGEHVVRFTFAPRSLSLGAGVSLAALAALALISFWPMLARRARLTQ